MQQPAMRRPGAWAIRTLLRRAARTSPRPRGAALVRALASILALAGLGASASFAVAELEPAEEVLAAAAETSREGFVASETASEAGVARSTFTRGVVEREPLDSLEVLGNDEVEVHYFTELYGFEGQQVLHRWSYRGVVEAEVPFEVGGARWRVHSRKALSPSQLGDWTVFVVDEGGRTISEQTLRYVEAPPPAPPLEGVR